MDLLKKWFFCLKILITIKDCITRMLSIFNKEVSYMIIDRRFFLIE